MWDVAIGMYLGVGFLLTLLVHTETKDKHEANGVLARVVMLLSVWVCWPAYCLVAVGVRRGQRESQVPPTEPPDEQPQAEPQGGRRLSSVNRKSGQNGREKQ